MSHKVGILQTLDTTPAGLSTPTPTPPPPPPLTNTAFFEQKEEEQPCRGSSSALGAALLGRDLIWQLFPLLPQPCPLGSNSFLSL